MTFRPGDGRVQQGTAAHLRSPAEEQVEQADPDSPLQRGMPVQARVAQPGTEVVDDDAGLGIWQLGGEFAEDVQLEKLCERVPGQLACQ